MEFKRPLRRFVYDAPKEMVKVFGGSVSQLVTKNHKIAFMTNGKIRSCEAENLKKSYQRPTSGFNKGPSENRALVRLAVAVQADGSFSGKRYRFHFRKPRKVERLISLLKDLNWEYRVSNYSDGSIGISCKRLNSVDKFLTDKKTWSWNILNYGPDILKCILLESVLWDGHQGKTSQVYLSSIKHNVEVMQTIAHLCGYQGRIRERKRCYALQISKRSYSRQESKEINYDKEKVYCLETNSGYFLIRYDGIISVTGNSNYDMGPITFAKNAGIPAADTKRLLNQYFATYPGIKNWHYEIQAKLKRKRELTTPLGRRRIFCGRIGDSLFKEAYAFIPQSTVADLVNQALIELYKEGAELLLQVHDSIVVQCEEEKIEETVRLVKKCMTRPVVINGKTIVIPTDIKIGKNWEEMKKYTP